MSAIAGIHRPDGQPVNRVHLQRMVETLAHRGPDSTGIWSEGSVGLGHRMLWTTPESLEERLPLLNETGDLAITADARIDNRDELMRALGLCGGVSAKVTDSELILAAYEKWGERCPEKLLGDYAFAIWDGRNRTLFCARDHFGVKPFYYHARSGHLFVFASEIKALLCLPEVPRRLNEVRVGEYLVPMCEDKAITFYQGILRLPPAHSLTVTPEGMRLRAYWSLDPSRELRLGSDEEYAEAFRELFAEAVRCRLRSAFPVGSQLSGGLDSSSVTCMARELLSQNANPRLPTFSAIFDQVPECDERPFIEAVLSQGNLEPHYVHPDRMGPLTDLDRVFWHQDEACPIPNSFLGWELYRAAHRQGVRVLLDGLDGDSVVSHGTAYLSELARMGRWAQFSEELDAVSQGDHISPWRYLEHYGLTYLGELARRGKWVTFARGANEISKRYDVSRWNLILNYGLKRLAPECIRRGWHALHGRNGTVGNRINPTIRGDFARRIGLKERIEAFYEPRMAPPRTEREEHYRGLLSGLQPVALEVINRAGAAFSIEPRHPFYDKRLAEFCLALPPQQKLNRGWNRMVMRRAMTDVLPEEVQWRADKSNLTPNFVRGLLIYERGLMDEVILNDPGAIEEYVDVAALRERYQRFLSQPTAYDADRVVWPAITLGLWLRQSGLTP